LKIDGDLVRNNHPACEVLDFGSELAAGVEEQQVAGDDQDGCPPQRQEGHHRPLTRQMHDGTLRRMPARPGIVSY
jgi:hypothetical protein